MSKQEKLHHADALITAVKLISPQGSKGQSLPTQQAATIGDPKLRFVSTLLRREMSTDCTVQTQLSTKQSNVEFERHASATLNVELLTTLLNANSNKQARHSNVLGRPSHVQHLSMRQAKAKS